MKKKQFIARLLVFAMLLTMLPFTAAAADEEAPKFQITDVQIDYNSLEQQEDPYIFGSDARVVAIGEGGKLRVTMTTDSKDTVVSRGEGTSGFLVSSDTTHTYSETVPEIPTEPTLKTLKFFTSDSSGNKKYDYTVMFTLVPDEAPRIWFFKDSLTLMAGESETMNVRTSSEADRESYGSIKDNTIFNWASSDETVATVSDNGEVKALKAGKAEITATLKTNPDVSAYGVVTVTDEFIFTLHPASLQLVLGELNQDGRPVWACPPGDAYTEYDFKDFTWSSSDTAVATVEQDGYVVAVAPGTATITATWKTDPTKSATCMVTVSAVPLAGSEVTSSIDNDALNSASPAVQQAMREIQTVFDTAAFIAMTEVSVVAGRDTDGSITIDGVKAADGAAIAAKITEAGDGAKAVIVPALDVVLAGGKAENGEAVSLDFELSFSAQVYVQKYEEGSLAVNEPVGDKVSVENPGRVAISLPLSSDFYNTMMKHKNVVKHTKGSQVFWHHPAAFPDGEILFYNSHGFSKFSVEVADDAALNEEYCSIADAIRNAKSGDTINVLQPNVSAEGVQKNLTFQLAEDLNATDVMITAGEGYTASRSGDGMTITITGGSGNSGSNSNNSSSGGGGSSKPSIRPGQNQTPATPTAPTAPTAPSGGVAGFSDVSPSAWYADAVQYVVDKGLFSGMSNGNFAPDANMTRAMMWTVLARYMGVDTSTGNWYEAARAWAIEKGISDGTMADGNVTREQFVTMLWRLSGEPTVDNSASFNDGGQISDYAKTAVDWAVAQGIVNGYNDGSFKPQGSATRAEVAKMLTVFCSNMEA